MGSLSAEASYARSVGLPLVYHDDYCPPLPPGHRFPMPKFKLLRDHLVHAGVIHASDVTSPRPATLDELHACHDPAYVHAFRQGTLDDRAVRRIGLPWSPALARRTVTAVGGTIRTAELAIRHGLACHAAGGTHHAHAAFGSGFCIFNDLACAARSVLDRHLVDRVLILDLDVHQGDGSATIFAHDPTAFTFSMHCAANFPLRKPPSDWDIALPPGTDDAGYLAALDDALPTLLDRAAPDASTLVLYDAGADVHEDDALGRFALTSAGMYERDRRVIAACRARELPVACVIGGGYDPDHARLARRHATVVHAARAVWDTGASQDFADAPARPPITHA